VIDQIFDDIRRSKFCIADLTGNNPNVFAELGYALALEKPIILLTQDGFEKLPFDIRHLRAFVYRIGARGHGQLLDLLGRVVREHRGERRIAPDKEKGVRFFVSTPLAGNETESKYKAFMGKMAPMLGRIRALKGVEDAYYFNEKYRTIKEFEAARWSVSEYLEKINDADYFVMIVNTDSVSGVYFESGYALARGIKSVYFVGPGGRIPQLMKRSAAAYLTLVRHQLIDGLADVPELLAEIVRE
jgi:nucleoside 2-deoxyribosyltransferase